jgi:hypothetical protein
VKLSKNKYTINGNDYVRVTRLIEQLDKPALVQSAANCTVKYIKENAVEDMLLYTVNDELLNRARFEFRKVSEEAKEIGSQVHDIIKHYIRGKIAGKEIDITKYKKYDERVENGFLAFLEWENQNSVEWLKSEFLVYHEKLCFAGTVDALCIINGRITIIDFKSSKGFFDGYDLQVTGYLIAYMSMQDSFSLEKPDLGILRLDKETGQPEYKDYTKKYKPEAFNHLVNYFYAYKKRRLNNWRTK